MPGVVTSGPEVTHISAHGLWVLLGEEELAVPYSKFPWFKHATVAQILAVERPSENHLYWPQLDIDLAVESLRNPEAFPLVSRAAVQQVGRCGHAAALRRKRVPASKPVSPRALKSDLARVDAHRIKKSEYEELPELDEEMLARPTMRRGGRPPSENPRKQFTLQLPADVIERWKATGPGWKARMAERLSKVR